MTVQPFNVRIPDETLVDLHARLALTRPAPRTQARGWEAGGNATYQRELVEYWRSGYDWRARERAINRFHHYCATVDNARVHFIHERGVGRGALPIVLTHGFPDSFLRFAKLIPLLVDPEGHGADPADAFDVIAPSLPGFGFSEAPHEHTTIFQVADLWHRLVTDVLGYSVYGAHGGDWGSTVTEHLGRSHGRNGVVGIHLTDVPFWHAFQKPKDATEAETAYLTHNEDFQLKQGAYAMIQGTRPHTLADGLNDSPAGLAAWIVEKFERWSDCDGDLSTRFSRDELLDQVQLYWATQTIATSFLPYYDLIHAGASRWMVEKAKELIGATVPTGFALFPKDLSHPPREWAERFFRVDRWTEMPRGGHFAAMEEPELLAEELRTFFRPLRAA